MKQAPNVISHVKIREIELMKPSQIDKVLEDGFGFNDKLCTGQSYGKAENYLKYADDDPIKNLRGFESMSQHWHYNDFVTWETIKKMIDEYQAENVADIGCGAGTWAVRISEKFPWIDVYGYDISEGQIELAKRTLEEHAKIKGREHVKDKIRFEVGDAAQLRRGRYDLSICLHDILNHIKDYGAAIDSMATIAKRHITSIHTLYGPRTFYATEPDNVRSWIKLGNWLMYRDGRGEFFVFYDHLFTLTEAVDAYRSHGVEVIDAFGIDVGVSAQLEKFRKNNPKLNVMDILHSLRKAEDSIKRTEPLASYGEHIMVISEPSIRRKRR